MSRFRRIEGGAVRLDLPPEERALLLEVARGLQELLAEGDADPGVKRLFPSAHEDPELDREFRDLTDRQLRTNREEALAVVQRTVESEALSKEEADAWLRALNDARLVLGTRLELTEDFDWDGFDPEHPDAEELALYAYLSWLQEQFLDVTR
jgi:Domain of unknown function (DUF2017)